MSSVKRIKVAHEVDEEDMNSSSNDMMKHIQDLPSDVFRNCLEFVGKGNFAFVAPVSKHFYWNYINLGVEMKNNVIDVDVILQQGRNKKTTVNDVVRGGSLRLATECFLKAPKELQVEVCRQAAVNGRLDVLKCAVAFGIEMDSVLGDDFYGILIQLAGETATNGHLDVMKFLHEQGGDLDYEEIIIEIGSRGKGSCLHWMASKGIISSSSEVFNYLVQDGEIDILKKSYEDPLHYVNEDTFNYCALGGNIEVMNWLLQQHECEWSSYLLSCAARSGSIPMMELCLQNGCPPREYICSSAMQNKNTEAALDALKWLREHDIPWNEDVCSNAAMFGNLKALKWARENGCPWDSQTFHYTAQYGSIEILDYCFENNCPVNHDIIYVYPFNDGLFKPTESELQERSLRVYKWLHQHSILWSDEASLVAARHGHLKTLMWAVENGCPWHEDILGCAIEEWDIPMVEYCLQHLSQTDDTVYVLAINKMKRMYDITDAKMIEILQKIHDYGIPWSKDIIALTKLNVANWLKLVGCPE
jgi:hypothetical protein